MTPTDLLAELKRRGITLRPEGADAIRYTAPRGAMTDELREAIRAHKHELLRLLAPGEFRRTEDPPLLPSPNVTFALSLQADGRCFLCGGSRWWLSRYGVLICAQCHPPTVPELVARYLNRKEAVELERTRTEYKSA